jgi:ABC-type transport system involved in multi-copper enzyme maturation permease subunit
MTWFAWRQFRFQAVVLFGLLVAVALFCALTGPHLFHMYDALKTCKKKGDCQSITHSVLNGYNKFFPFVQSLSLIFPVLVGMFWGAPLVARELEAGTYRLAWTQGVTRKRWLLTKLAVVGAASMLAAGLMSLTLTWWASPLDTLNASRFSSVVFDTSYITPIGYAAFAFALGVTAGVLWRRTVPAMATTIAVFIAVRIPFFRFVRPHLLAPVTRIVSLKNRGNMGFERTPNGVSFVVGEKNIPNALGFSTSVVNKHGGGVTQQWLRDNCRSLLQLGSPNTSKGVKVTTGIRPKAFTECIDKIATTFHEVLLYQPANRFWTFQWIEMAIYIVAAVLLGALSYWWVRRRIA